MSLPPRGGKPHPEGKRDYVADLGSTLRRRDPEALRNFLLDQARQFGDESQAAEISGRGPDEMAALMHQMTLARPDLAALHPESRAWLTERGHPVPLV
jgi:hypothetical protein